jgi:NHL repeat
MDRLAAAAVRAGLFPCILFAGCGGDAAVPTRTPVTVVVDTVNGVERVTSSGGVDAWALRPIVDIGSEGGTDGPADDEFAWVSSVSIGPDGLIYIADLGNHRIVVFDTLGVLRATIGREGSGPGEFRSLYSIAWIGDNLATLDIGNGRFMMRSAVGEWQTPTVAPGRLVASPVDYRLYAVGADEVYQWAYHVVDGVIVPTWLRQRRDGPGEEWNRRLDAPESPFPEKVVCTRGRGFSWFDHPYATRALVHPAPGRRSYRAATDAYTIALVASNGDTVSIIRRAVEPARITDAEWAGIRARFDEWLEDKNVAACKPPSLERPATKPPIVSLMVDVDGRLWVERNMETGTLWEIFDADGRVIASLPGFVYDRQRTVPWLSRDRIAWVTRGESDFPQVHVARIIRSPAVGS